MRDYTEKIRTQSADLLEPAEEVFRAVMGNPEGSFLVGINKGQSVARAATTAVTADKADEGIAMRIPKKSAYVTLTDRRVLILGTSAMGKVKSILAQFSFDEVDALRVEGAGVKKHDLILDFADHTSYRYTIIQNQQPQDMADEFARRKG